MFFPLKVPVKRKLTKPPNLLTCGVFPILFARNSDPVTLDDVTKKFFKV